jgi:hypothetical protein
MEDSLTPTTVASSRGENVCSRELDTREGVEWGATEERERMRRTGRN